MKDIMFYCLARAREPSTYAGLAAVLTAFHIADASSWASNIGTMCMGVAGVAAMAMKETGIK